jgi:EAL domain-containing protein (putative c-di-GMP-specific phosphodiesterase class I)
MVSPAEFIPLAEEIGVIVPLGAWVIQQACRDAAVWPKDIGVAVNLSSAQFKGLTLVQTVVSALEASGLSPFRLELEITESALLTDNESTIATLNHLRSLGVRIAMDDFGTGYSSLSYLRSFPFDKIKIDRSFIKDLGATGECSAIVRAVASLGAALGMTTTAEGVETAEQLRQIRDQGCTEVQGYFFGRPCPVEALHGVFEKRATAA